MKKALVTGITGQDGSYLAELLLQKGYKVSGLVRFSRHETLENIQQILKDLTLLDADLLDYTSLVRVLEQVQPDEVYNLAAQSFVPMSWYKPTLTADINSLGVTRLLEAIRTINPKMRFYQASSSEMFGHARETPQNEKTPFCPVSPYAASKVHAHFITQMYREAFGIPASCGICFNHESPRRGLDFVTRKVTHGAAKIKLGLAKEISMGNLEAQRDWGYAPDYVEAMWLMLQQPEPDDYVIATGKSHSIKDLLEVAFACIKRPWQEHVRTDPNLQRPTDLDSLVGDSRKAKQKLNWFARKSFQELIEEMVESDLKSLKKN